MDISDIAKLKWEKGGEEFEKWYNAELELTIFSKGAIPLILKARHHSLHALSLNNRFYYERNGNWLWEEDRKNVLKENSVLLKKLIFETEKSVEEVKSITKYVKNARIINEYALSEIKRAFVILWHILLSDLGKVLPQIIKKRITNKGLSGKQIEEVMYYCFNFKHPFGYQKEEDDLRKIKLLIQEKYADKKIEFEKLPRDIKKLIVQHWKEYRYLTGGDLNTEPYEIRDFLNNLYSMPIKTKVTRKKITQTTKKLLDKDAINFFMLVHRHIFLDNYAADLYEKLDFLMVAYLSEYFGISFPNLSWYSFAELEELVEKKKRLSTKDLEKREKYRVMVQINGKLKCFYGKANFQKINSIVSKRTKLVKIKTFPGIVASMGIVKGLAKIVKSRKDIGKVNSGDILVAPTTHPDLMMAIRACAAIVTDSGGITSHAAIISRELRIPCIVGTDIATQVLNDGDLVRVDANKGVVKILK